MVVDADLSDGDYLPSPSELFNNFKVLGAKVLCAMRMDARRRADPGVVPEEFKDERKAEGICDLNGTQERFDAAVQGSPDDRVAVFVKLPHIQMGMGIDDLDQDKILPLRECRMSAGPPLSRYWASFVFRYRIGMGP